MKSASTIPTTMASVAEQIVGARDRPPFASTSVQRRAAAPPAIDYVESPAAAKRREQRSFHKMAWETRGKRRYYYRARWQSGSVKTYVGRGPLGRNRSSRRRREASGSCGSAIRGGNGEGPGETRERIGGRTGRPSQDRNSDGLTAAGYQRGQAWPTVLAGRPPRSPPAGHASEALPCRTLQAAGPLFVRRHGGPPSSFRSRVGR